LLYREDTEDIDLLDASMGIFLFVTFLAICKSLTTLIPPAVENAQPPINIIIINRIFDSNGVEDMLI
jgi:hypothetical protein